MKIYIKVKYEQRQKLPNQQDIYKTYVICLLKLCVH